LPIHFEQIFKLYHKLFASNELQFINSSRKTEKEILLALFQNLIVNVTTLHSCF